MLLLPPFPHGISGEERRASALRKLWPEGPQRRREAQPGEAKAASIWLGGGRRGGGKIPGEAKINRVNAGRSRARWLT